jgi:hypothetical protein
VEMWESVLGISTFPHAVVDCRPPHHDDGAPKASVVSLLFALS